MMGKNLSHPIPFALVTLLAPFNIYHAARLSPRRYFAHENIQSVVPCNHFE